MVIYFENNGKNYENLEKVYYSDLKKALEKTL